MNGKAPRKNGAGGNTDGSGANRRDGYANRRDGCASRCDGRVPLLTPGKLWGLRRMSDERGLFRMVAADQRPPIKNPIAAHLGVEQAPYDEVARVKALLIETLGAHASAMLLDPHYAIPRGLHHLSPTRGLVVTLEDSVFKERHGGRLSASIEGWSVEKIKRMGGDAVKVLVWYRPDADERVLAHQRDYAARVGDDCARYDIPYLLEMLVHPLPGDADQTRDYREMGGKSADHVLETVREFAKPRYGVDVFKLESPIAGENVPGPDGEGGPEVQALFDEMGRLAGRPWVMLSAGASPQSFERVLQHAFEAGASGFLAGRAIWLDAFGHYPDWARMRAELEDKAADYMARINALASDRATPWHAHGRFGGTPPAIAPDDGGFRFAYEGFGAVERFADAAPEAAE